MASAAEKIADRFIRRDIDLERFFAGARKETLARIDKLVAELQVLAFKIDPASPARLSVRQARLQRLIGEAAGVIRTAYAEIGKTHGGQRRLLAGLEEVAARAVTNQAVGVALATVALTSQQITAVLSDAVVGGTTTREWWARQSTGMRQRFADTMRQGVLNGETIDRITRTLKERGFREAFRRQAEGLVRTSFQAVSNEARQATFLANQRVIKQVQQRTTLDSRTSDICIAYSGKVWSLPEFKPVGHSLPFNSGPPRHFNCRSNLIPITKSWDELAGRRLPGGKGTPQQTLDQRFAAKLRARGMSEKQIAAAKRRTQASMDGQVAADLDFESWLKTKSEPFQRKVLGETKFELWKSGKLKSLRELVDQSGRPLTIEQLAKKVES